MLPPRSLTACSSLPPEGAAAPADWRSQIRGPCLTEEFGGFPLPVALARIS